MHICVMRSHREIAETVGPDKLATALDLPLSTTRSWPRRNSIPAEFWRDFVSRRWATYSELASAAAAKRERSQVSA